MGETSEPVDHDLARVDLDVGHELHGQVDGSQERSARTTKRIFEVGGGHLRVAGDWMESATRRGS
jgi:hypothetical protein